MKFKGELGCHHHQRRVEGTCPTSSPPALVPRARPLIERELAPRNPLQQSRLGRRAAAGSGQQSGQKSAGKTTGSKKTLAMLAMLATFVLFALFLQVFGCQPVWRCWRCWRSSTRGWKVSLALLKADSHIPKKLNNDG